jgi:hypothetical protein
MGTPAVAGPNVSTDSRRRPPLVHALDPDQDDRTACGRTVPDAWYGQTPMSFERWETNNPGRLCSRCRHILGLDQALLTLVGRRAGPVTAPECAEQLWDREGWHDRFEPSARSRRQPREQFYDLVARRLRDLHGRGQVALADERGWRGARQYHAAGGRG